MQLRPAFLVLSLCFLGGCQQTGPNPGLDSEFGTASEANESQTEIADKVASDVRENGCDLSRYVDFEKTIGAAVRRINDEREKNDPAESGTAASYTHALLTVADASQEAGCLYPAESFYKLVLELPPEPAIADYQTQAKAGIDAVDQKNGGKPPLPPASGASADNTPTQ